MDLVRDAGRWNPFIRFFLVILFFSTLTAAAQKHTEESNKDLHFRTAPATTPANRTTQTLNTLSCTSSLGDPIVNVTFGAGPNPGPPLGSITNMQYLASPCPNDGQYTIANFSSNCFNNAWHTVRDHTGDANGYFMLVNASFTPSDFYVQRVPGLCSGTTYEFSAWVANVLRSTTGIQPNITFSIETTDGTVLQRNTTGDIPAGGSAEWKRYSFFFTTPPNVSTVVIRMTNNAPGGMGNDLALDDITFRPAGPLTTIRFRNGQGDSVALCNRSFAFESDVENCYPTTQYQWQEYQGNGKWADIPNAIDQQLSVTAPAAGTYKYRLLVSQAGNIQLTGCRVVSNTLTVKVHPPAINVRVDTTICAGQSFTLPSGAPVTTAGLYRDTLRYREGCDSAIRVIALNITTTRTLISSDTICQNQRYSLPWGQIVSVAGTYRDTLRTATGCDSLQRTIILAVKTLSTRSNAVTICPGRQFQLPWGPVVGSTGIYRDTLRYASGCDSLVQEVRLLVMQAVVSKIDEAICTGQTYRLPWGPVVSTAGIYRDTVKSSNGCDSLVFEVRLAVNAYPVVSLSKSNDVDCKLGVAKLAATGGTTYQWSPAASLSDASIANPVASPRQTTTYRVQVSRNGCTVEDSLTVFVSFANAGQGFYVPSAFSPNGDGKNDCFGVPHWGAVERFHLQVFNRWGELVFRTRDVAGCWNGTYKGQMQGPGVFVYLITAETICGLVERKGTLTLIR